MTLPSRSQAIARWWPTTQSLDLVEGPVEVVAAAVEAEFRRFAAAEPVTVSWEEFPKLDAAFGAACDFANVPTFLLILPTRSRWSVLWNNSFLCDGYDSLCWCLSTHHGLTTLHWSAHDTSTTFQPGATFQYRRREAGELVERFVQVAREDERWLFQERGQPLPQEDVACYRAKRRRDRLNEGIMMELLTRLGAAPWSEDFYAVPGAPCCVLRRDHAPSTVIRRRREEVVRPG